MHQYLSNIPPEFISLSIALGLGVLIGVERTFAHKTAGMRTYGLVSLCSCLLVILSSGAGLDTTTKMAAGIITGIGFLCGGVIIFQNHHLSGLTTAAGLWIATGIGMAVGFGRVDLAIFATGITLVVLTLLWFLEQLVIRVSK